MSIKLWDTVPLYDAKINNEENEGCPSMDEYLVDSHCRSAVVICPGGGYNHRSLMEGGHIAEALNKIGINAFVVNYRVAPYKHPVEINDAKRAMRYVRYNAEKYNIDSDKIGIMGFSAGAHLACTVTEYYDMFDLPQTDDIDMVSARPNLLCLCYPVISAGKAISHNGSFEDLLGDKTELIADMSCEDNIREDMPPVFIWHTFEDGSVDCRNSLVMATRLKEKNLPFELHLFPDGKHGVKLAEDIEGTNQWFGLYENWLKRQGFCI